MTRRLAWTASIAMVTVLLVAAALPATANAEELWFPVELPLDSYADTWGAPRGGGRSHEGTDILAPQMRRVYAAASGEIIKALGEDCQDGQVCSSYYLAVAGDDGRGYFYVHLNNDTPGRPDGCDGLGGVAGAFSPRLVEQLEDVGTLAGTRVVRGEHIGWQGSSGNAACGVDQLHFEIWSDHDWGSTGKINPYQELVDAEAAGRTGDGATGGDEPSVVRDAGDDRIGTAIALSRTAHADASGVVLVPAEDYVPALVAAPLAALHHSPVLLVPSNAPPPDALVDEVRRLGATSATAVGDIDAAALEALVYTTGIEQVQSIRADGPTELSVAVADAVVAGGGDPDHIVVAPVDLGDGSRGWPDALMASTLAAYRQAPVLLATADGLTNDVKRHIEGSGPSTADVVGGTAVIAETVVDDLRAAEILTRRLAGADRLGTGLAVTAAILDGPFGAAASVLHVATAADYPDALAAGPAMAAQGSVFVLADPSGDNLSVLDWVGARADSIDVIHAIGGRLALPDETVSALAAGATGSR